LASLELPETVRQEIAQGKVGATTAVKQSRRKPAGKGKKASARPTRVSCAAGSAVVTVKPGHTLADVLLGLLEQERGKAAA
jgi:hypothetical protein